MDTHTYAILKYKHTIENKTYGQWLNFAFLQYQNERRNKEKYQKEAAPKREFPFTFIP